MNVSAAPPPPTPADTPGSAGARPDAKAAPSAFDALVAEVGGSEAEEPAARPAPKESAAKPATKAEAETAARVDGEASEADVGDGKEAIAPADPMLAVLAALMTPPAKAPEPTTAATATTTGAPAAAAVVGAAPEPVLPAIEADAPVLAAEAAAATTEGSVAVGAETAVALDAAATAGAKPAVEAPVPAARDRTARSEAVPTTEASARAAAEAVKTETAGAVTALAAASKGGEEAAANAGDPATTPVDAPSSTPAPTAAAAQARTEAAAPAIEAQVVRGSPETVARLSAEILRKLDGRSTRFDVALDPLGLGHVSVKVEIAAHGHLTAALQFENANAAAELRNRAGELRTALQQAGFDVSDNGLSFDVANQNSGQGGAQNAWNFQDQGGGRAQAGRAFEAALTGAEALVSDIPYFRPSLRDGVDVRI